MGLSRRVFTKEFKLAALQRLETGASVAEVARAFEVNPNVLHRWRREFRRGARQCVSGLGRREHHGISGSKRRHHRNEVHSFAVHVESHRGRAWSSRVISVGRYWNTGEIRRGSQPAARE